MRRISGCVALILVSIGALVVAAQAREPVVRDIGPMVGFRRHESSYTISVADVNKDGWPDVLIGHHGSRPAELFMNQPDGNGGTWGFEPVFRLVDDIHDRPDRHGCAFG